MSKIKVAKIINSHGIRGELKISPIGNEVFDKGTSYYIGDNYTEVVVENSRLHKGHYIVKFDQYDDINQVLRFKDKDLYINEDDLAILEEDEFYIKDLIGMEVYSEGSLVGHIEDVLDYQANDVYVVKTMDNKELMVPAVGEFILDVDLSNNRMDIKIIEGM